MNSERRSRLWALVVDGARGGTVAVDHVCAASVSATGVDSAAVAVTLRATPREVLCASDRTASELEELTVTLGEGPCVDASSGGPDLIADLAAPECLTRWPAFAPAAVLAGV
ncbi:ANTAR domain-containing protein, partial [Micromonospora globispora]